MNPAIRARPQWNQQGRFVSPRRVRRDSDKGVTPTPHADAQRTSARSASAGVQRRRRERAPPDGTPPDKRKWGAIDTERHDFVPYVLLPSQFYSSGFHGGGTATGALRLLRAVFENAVHTWLHYRQATDARGQRLFEETEAWFKSTRGDYLCAFESICEHLQLDSTYIRRGLHAWPKDRTTLMRAGPRK